MQVNGFYRDIDLDEATGDEGEVKTKYNQLTGVTKSLIPVSNNPWIHTNSTSKV